MTARGGTALECPTTAPALIYLLLEKLRYNHDCNTVRVPVEFPPYAPFPNPERIIEPEFT